MTEVTKAKLLLVGCGKMGGALLAGWLAQGVKPAHVQVVDPGAPQGTDGVARHGSMDGLPADFVPDVVVLAVKPQVMADVIGPYARFKGQAAFLSIAAGKTIGFFERILGADAAIVRTMPNTPAAVGRGVTALYANAPTSAPQKALCTTLMQAVGTALWLDDEGQMDAVTAVSGSGPAYIFHMAEALTAAALAAGLSPDMAATLARATVCGAGELLYQAAEDPAQLRKNVTSPGGTTAAALDVLMNEKAGLTDLMTRAVAAAANRSRELAG